MKSIFAFVFIILSSLSFAQTSLNPTENRGKIKGIIIDSTTQQPVEFVNLVLIRIKDSSMVQGAITNEKGAFVLDRIPIGSYKLKISFIGYFSKEKSGIQITQKNKVIDLGNIKISNQAKSLKEFEVTADKPMFEYSLDKKVINVEKNITSTGGTAVDVLRNIPSVTVDDDNNISLRGQSNINILINGRPSGITGTKLDQIPASMIENIEIITNPSAKYNPDGMTGIINIKLKKRKTMGFNGSATVGAASGDKYNSSINLNYNLKKINLFGSYDVRSDIRNGYGDFSRKTDVMNDTSSFLTQHSDSRRNRNSNNFKLGMDYFLDSKNTLTFQCIYNNNFKRNYEKTDAKESLFNDSLKTTSFDFYNTGVEEIENENDFDYSVNYKKTFDKKGKELTADLILCTNKGFEKEFLDEQHFKDTLSKWIPFGNLYSQYTINDGKSNSTTFQMNFTDPLKNEDSKYEAGIQAIIDNSDNYFHFNDEYLSSEWKENLLRSNHFIYKKQIYSVYGTYANTIKDFKVLAGLRLEDAFTKAQQQTTSETFNRNYFSLFPSLHISHKLGKTADVQISYSRRINRPRSEDLNPFIDYSHPESIRYGNPYLKPEYINSFELGGMKKIKKTSINVDIFYRQINDVIKRIVSVDSQRISHMTFANLSSGKSYGVEFIVEQPIFKFWKMNVNYSYFRTIISGDNVNTNLTNNNYSWTAKMNSSMILPKKFFFQLTGFYNGPMVTPQGTIKEMYSMDAALKKDFWKDNASLSFRISDIFNTFKFSTNIIGDGFTSDMVRKRETQIFYVTFTYRINQDIKLKSKPKEENSKSPYDEGF